MRIFATLGFCLLVSLGVWQLQRLAWKENLIQQIQTQQELPVVALTSETQSPFRRVYAEGHFNYDKEIRLIGKTVDQQQGYYVFTPLILMNGHVVYVNRGWVPQGESESKPTGNIHIEGVLKEKMSRNAFTPHSNYEAREIFAFDPHELEKIYHDQTILPYFIDASQIHPQGEYPIIKPLGVHLRNNHLVYALTWFALAGGLAIVSFIFIRKRRQSHKS